MIPYAILQCTVLSSSGETLELRVLELSDRYFTVRVCDEAQAILMQATSIRMSFFQQTSGTFARIFFSEFRLVQIEKTEFWHTWQISPQSEEFKHLAIQLSREYLQYIRLKITEDDATLSEALTGYPSEKEQLFAENYPEQYRKWMHGLCPDSAWNTAVNSAAELAIWLDRPALWDAFLSKPFPDFFRNYVDKLNLSTHPFAELLPDTVYFGNQYCTHLMPDADMLGRLLQKAESEHLHAVTVFPPLQENAISHALTLLSALQATESRKSELIVNDWGTLYYLKVHSPDSFQVTAGSMLFRHTRDPRLAFQPALNQTKSAGISKDYSRYLRQEYGISAVSTDLAFLPDVVTPIKRCLQLPFYQTNTSSYCPLYAVCQHGQRGKQQSVQSCPQFCSEYAFLYPSFLTIIGIGNSLFGFQKDLMEQGTLIQKALRPGVDRLVFLFP